MFSHWHRSVVLICFTGYFFSAELLRVSLGIVEAGLFTGWKQWMPFLSNPTVSVETLLLNILRPYLVFW